MHEDNMSEEKQQTLEELQKDFDLLKEQFQISLLYTAFVYGAASAGDPLAIKLVSLHSKDETEDEDFSYTIGVKKK